MASKKVEILVKFEVEISNKTKLSDDNNLFAATFHNYLNNLLYEEHMQENDPYFVSDIEIVASHYDQPNSTKSYKWEVCYIEESKTILQEKYLAKYTEEELNFFDNEGLDTSASLLVESIRKNGKKKNYHIEASDSFPYKIPSILCIKNLETGEVINYI